MNQPEPKHAQVIAEAARHAAEIADKDITIDRLKRDNQQLRDRVEGKYVCPHCGQSFEVPSTSQELEDWAIRHKWLKTE